MTDHDTKDRSTLSGFIHHQTKAVEESGKALASLLPKDFRDHAGNAIGEVKASWKVLFGGMKDKVEGRVEKLRSASTSETPGKEKIEIEME